MAISGIYKIEHRDSGRCYIGSAIDIGRRVSHHRCLLKRGKHHSRFLQASWDKYGADSFTFSTVCLYDEHLLLHVEQRFIDILSPEFNVFKFAVNSARGVKRSEETKKRMSEAQKGKPRWNDEQREQIRQKSKGNRNAVGKGYMLTDEQRRVRAENARRTKNAMGHVVSSEAKSKISASKAANPYTMTDGHRAAIKASAGWKHEESTLKRMSEIKRQWWADRKRAQA